MFSGDLRRSEGDLALVNLAVVAVNLTANNS